MVYRKCKVSMQKWHRIYIIRQKQLFMSKKKSVEYLCYNPLQYNNLNIIIMIFASKQSFT